MARDAAVLLTFDAAEIDSEQAAARLQNPPYLADAAMASLVGQVMEHHGAEDDIEGPIGERERLDCRGIESQSESRPARFLFRPRDDFG